MIGRIERRVAFSFVSRIDFCTVAQPLKIHTKRYRMPTMRHDVGLKQLAKTCSVCRREAERDETAASESRLSAPSA